MKRIITIESITGIWQFSREPAHYKHYSSTPGHLLHLVTSGSYHLRMSGRDYHISAGDLIYYHESEEYEWIKNNERVEYISIGFMASQLSPPPIQLRVLKTSPTVRQSFENILQLSTDTKASSMLKTQMEILNILVFLEEKKEEVVSTLEPAQLEFWWQIENTIRQNQSFRPTMTELCKIGSVSSSTLIRKCQEATQLTPFKRVQKIRMQEAHGLLTYTDFNITHISELLGYKRIHEFSNEFSKYFGYPPSRLK